LLKEVIKEVGIRRIIKFYLGQIQVMILKLLLLPPNLRRSLLNMFGAKIGKYSVIHSVTFNNIYRTGFAGFSCGEKCFIGDECFLDLADGITLEDHVTIAARVTLLTHLNVGFKDHPLQEHFPAYSAPVHVGRGSFIGANSVVLAGVKIGRNSLVSAGAVVISDVPDNSVVAGVPAKVIKTLPGGVDKP